MTRRCVRGLWRSFGGASVGPLKLPSIETTTEREGGQMGLFSKVRDLTGAVPKELLQNGLLGRGIITEINQSSVSTGAEFDPALSLGERPPTVTAAASGDPKMSSAARILENGARCQAIIVQSQPLGMRNPKGDDMYAFLLTVMADGRAPYQIQVGNPVPATAVPLLYPGNTVPAKRMPEGDDHEVVIDWEEALAQLAHSAA